MTDRALSLCKASFGILDNETTRRSRERLGKVSGVETDKAYKELVDRHVEMVENHIYCFGGHPAVLCIAFCGFCFLTSL